MPKVIDLPTGLGKTMVMAIWLIARAADPRRVPTRLVYVVDRRTVVDQATDLAMRLKEKSRAALGIDLAVSTLRGQLADNREWSADPTRPAIVIGTVDLIGSDLLFSGYRSSFKRRPHEAGLLGIDALLVLDEAHLSRPFEKLLQTFGGDSEKPGFATEGLGDSIQLPKPLQVIRMSATSKTDDGTKPFELDTNETSERFELASSLDEEGEETNNVKKRYEATKTLRIETAENDKKFNERLANEAVALATRGDLKGKRIVVFVRKPVDARKIATLLRDHAVETTAESGSKPKKVKKTPYSDTVEVLTGTMRGLERDKLVETTVLKRFLDGEEKPGEKDSEPVFLVSTSAGEVGFDLNADHLVSDPTTLDSFIQRLGRVNRRGYGDAHVVLVRPKALPDKTDYEKACKATVELLRDGLPLSPKAIGEWKQSLTPDQAKAATSPEPTTLELTDILLDAWSMTSIREKMPGRPEVGPWLRGIEEDAPQTSVAWRAELDLFRHEESVNDSDKARQVSDCVKALKQIFAKHPIRPHETLTVSTRALLEEFLKKLPKPKGGAPDPRATRCAIQFSRGQVLIRTIQQLIDDPGPLYADSTLILPASFGGLDGGGMLSAESVFVAKEVDETKPASLEVADIAGYEHVDAAVSRLRVLITRGEKGWTVDTESRLGAPPANVLQIVGDAPYNKSTALINNIQSAGYRLRLVQPLRFDDEGSTVESLVCLAPAAESTPNEDQALADHVKQVSHQAERIADNLNLAPENPLRVALLFAARWHDEGKKADGWQRYANGPMPDGSPKGKSDSYRDPKSLRRYRHEFGSLLRLAHPGRCGESTEGPLPEDPDVCDLALHLIATHHGGGRPHFPMALYEGFTDEERDAVHAEVMRRFGRLQRKYGWWRLAWIENLLRCADQAASGGEEVTEVDEPEGDD